MNQTAHFLHVAVGVVKNADGQVLISQRAATAHQGGLWEFPGGKVENGETAFAALRRELHEELGITVERASPLLKIRHHYADLSVLLDVWQVEEFSGRAEGRENQEIQWVSGDNLKNYAFPAANQPILHAVQLPRYYAILPESATADLLDKLLILLNKDIKLIQARFKTLPEAAVRDFLAQALPVCEKYQAKLQLNSAVKNAAQLAAHGLHLTSADLMRLTDRPRVNGWIAASCHDLAQLQQAEKLNLDFAVLAPVLPTPTHPDAPTLGWEAFAALVAQVNLPVYALGGVNLTDKSTAWNCGAFGLAGIRAFLNQAK